MIFTEYLNRLDTLINEERLSLSGPKSCSNFEEYKMRLGKIIGMMQIRDDFNSVFIKKDEEYILELDLQEY